MLIIIKKKSVLEWFRDSYLNLGLRNILYYFAVLSVSFHDLFSLFGFFSFLIILIQIISGIMLSFSVVTEPMLVPTVREEEDSEDLYIDDFFWLHERGVDLIFICSYIHLFRKLYLSVFEYENESAWKSGVFTFLIFQVVVFFGLVLCCTHLSDITLTIAANIFHTFFLFLGKFYWWIFTDKNINTDTMIRVAYGHYVIAFYLVYLGLIHGIDIHYDWKTETTFDGLDSEMIWWDEALSNELSGMIDTLLVCIITCFMFFTEPEALSYEIFMWGDIGFVTDIRYYGVSPHWYFRSFMAWLIVCPYHKIGVFGLLFFFLILFYQPVIHGINEQNSFSKKLKLILKKKSKKKTFFSTIYINSEINLFHQLTFFSFVTSCLYTISYLPYGRFFTRLGGNIGTLFAFMYIFLFLGFTSFRRLILLELYWYLFYLKIFSLTIWKK